MQLIRGMYNFHSVTRENNAYLANGCALTIGNFDGVHLGHQTVLRHLRDKADQRNLPVIVMLFEPQPREFFQKSKAPARLMRLRDKLSALSDLGVDAVICVKFGQTFAALSAQDFIQDWLIKKLNVKFLSIGDDFRFGAQRQGDFSLLQQAGKQFGFTVEDNHSFRLNEQRISSTAIRQALFEDNLPLAQELLGRPYAIWGKVVHGKKLGRTLGFPTANIRLHRQVNPVQGVYAVKIHNKAGRFFYGVANVGQRPTVNGVQQLLEVHLFDFEDDLYGQTLLVEFCKKIRNEIKFSSLDALKAQIEQDTQSARNFFRQNPYSAE